MKLILILSLFNTPLLVSIDFLLPFFLVSSIKSWGLGDFGEGFLVGE